MSQNPRRKLGQHFLADPRYRRRVVDAAEIRPDDLVVEIGAGRGAMTGLLAERARRVIAIELDSGLASHLKRTFAENPRIEIVAADILTTDIAALCRSEGTTRCFAFGNLPYYITSPILEHLSQFRSAMRSMALLVQREVAERIAAAPGSRDYGYLSVFVQVFSRPRMKFKVPPGAFVPPPKVESALVTATVEPRFPDWTDEKQARFLEFVKICFTQKRKNIFNNLSRLAGRPEIEEALGKLPADPTVRAEQLTIENLARLYELVGNRPDER